MVATPSQKVAVFTAFQDTAAYLKERIESQPDVLGGRKWTVAVGSETSADTRTRELERFCPESVRDEPGFRPDGGEVDVILSTDILRRPELTAGPSGALLRHALELPARGAAEWHASSGCAARTTRRTSIPCSPSRATWTGCSSWKPSSRQISWLRTPRWGMETPVLAGVEMESQVYADLSTFVKRLSGGDAIQRSPTLAEPAVARRSQVNSSVLTSAAPRRKVK